MTEKYGLATTYPAKAPRSCEISNVFASGITATSALLNARFKGTDSWFRVRAFWGTADGGTSAAAWQNSALVGDCTNVPSADISLQVVPAQTNTIYFFRFSASNLTEQLWSQTAFPFACPLMTKTISASAGVGGSIAPSGSVQVVIGQSQAFNIVPATGYRIFDVKEDGVSKGAVSSYCVENIATNHSVSAFFAVITNTITASVTAGNGSISPSGAVEVAYGASQTFSISGNPRYMVTNVVVDGASAGAVSSYTFTNVVRPRSITAYFGAMQITDDDNDGMADALEVFYFGETAALNGGPGEDWDGDGFSNMREFVAGTSPADTNSAFSVSIARSGNSILVTVPTVLTGFEYWGFASRHYRIEEGSSLTGMWAETAGYTNFTSTGQSGILTNSAPVPGCFYRARVWLAP